jgi:hypothetical protein
MASMDERNKTLVPEAINTLFNKRDYEAALQFVPAAGMSPFGLYVKKSPGSRRPSEPVFTRPRTLADESAAVDRVLALPRFPSANEPRGSPGKHSV